MLNGKGSLDLEGGMFAGNLRYGRLQRGNLRRCIALGKCNEPHAALSTDSGVGDGKRGLLRQVKLSSQ